MKYKNNTGKIIPIILKTLGFTFKKGFATAYIKGCNLGFNSDSIAIINKFIIEYYIKIL